MSLRPLLALPAILVWLAAAVAPAQGQPPAVPQTGTSSPVSVAAVAAKGEVSVGEVFAIEVTATGPRGTSFEFTREMAGDSFDLRTPAARAEGEPSPLPPGKHRYEATVFAVGQAEIPAIPVRYRLPDGTAGEAASQPIPLRIVSLLPKNPQEQKLADIRGPLAVSIGAAFWMALAAVLVLLGALVALWWRRRRRRPQEAAAVPLPVVPPDMEAERELALLEASGLLEKGEYRAFYIRLTVIAKRYLERRLVAPILEMTSAETLAFLRGHPMGGELLGVVRDIAEAADRIKFARGEGLTAEAERHLAAVRALVRTLEARLAPRPVSAEKAA